MYLSKYPQTQRAKAAKNKQLVTYTLDQIKDEFIRKVGTDKRTLYEQELKRAAEEEKTDEVDRESYITEN